MAQSKFEGMTANQIREFLRKRASKGGQMRAKRLTAEERQKIALKAAAARWKKGKRHAK